LHFLLFVLFFPSPGSAPIPLPLASAYFLHHDRLCGSALLCPTLAFFCALLWHLFSQGGDMHWLSVGRAAEEMNTTAKTKPKYSGSGIMNVSHIAAYVPRR
jgi:hypothetical protein